MQTARPSIGRPKSPSATSTVFGRFLDSHDISYEEAARELGITRQYVNQLATGSNPSGPSFRLINKIRDYAAAKGGRVPPKSWELEERKK